VTTTTFPKMGAKLCSTRDTGRLTNSRRECLIITFRLRSIRTRENKNWRNKHWTKKAHKNPRLRSSNALSYTPHVSDRAVDINEGLKHIMVSCNTVHRVACEQALKVKWEPASMTNEFEYLPRNVRFSKHGMSSLIWCCLQLSCKLNLDRAN
jgi:hypothetical protein